MPKLVHISKMPSRSQRPDPATLLAWQPGKSAKRVLQYCLDYRYLTPELAALLYAADHPRGKGGEQVRSQLTKLWRYGYLERFYRGTDVGSTAYVYTIAVDGAHLLIDEDEWQHVRRSIYNVAKPKANYEHQLQVSLLHVLWRLGSRSHEELFETAAIWQDKEGWGKKIVNRFVAQVDGEPVTVDPDFTVLFAHHARGYYRPIFFEVQRSHKAYERIRRTLLAYEYLLSKAGDHAVGRVFDEQLGIVPDRGMAVFVLESDQDLRNLFGKAKRLLRARTELWFTTLDRLHRTIQLTRKDGTPMLDRHGNPRMRVVPIEPHRFFEDDLLIALDGKSGKLII